MMSGLRVSAALVLIATLLVPTSAALGGPAKASKPKAARPPAPKLAKAKPTALPRFVELGAEKCIPCRMMQPILQELRTEQRGRIEVVFIDVWENPRAAEQYRIRVIPTQVFLDAQGKEFYRHEGFLPKEDIMAKFRERGIKLNPSRR